MIKRIFVLPYQLLIWLPVFAVISVLTALITTLGCLCGGEKYFAYYPGMIWSRLVCILSLCPVKITGREKLNKKQSYIFAANHQSIYDIFLIYGYLGQAIKWIMKKSLRKIPFIGKACETAGFIFVDNSSPKAAVKTVEEAEKRLVNGASVVIFPEGSRTPDGKMRNFKKGAYQMALDLKLPIVPITINGSFDVMPIHSYLLNPHKIELIIHDPIHTSGYVSDDLRQLSSNIRELQTLSRDKIVSKLWDKYRPE
ncbi:MAG: 1-acyl-sn-glycerol-3-phosphate acyltransferase [Dysgonamonadaceae bacterium]|jgi:1-acyl-sn-glycerol-3-phosphate acyltransferase|nr:1-acyl-sn-glycerol-3-phosphate acyltransferase [Dysgonamonadaceae bacterium]